MPSNLWLVLAVTSNPPPKICICTVDSRPQINALFQPKWTSDNLCNCKRTVFGVQRFLLPDPCLHVRSSLPGQIGSSHILDLGQRDWDHCVFSSGARPTMRWVLLDLALPLTSSLPGCYDSPASLTDELVLTTTLRPQDWGRGKLLSGSQVIGYFLSTQMACNTWIIWLHLPL